jgi:hypothetical protein
MTTIAANPGTGIGTTSGMAKNISDVPKEVPPMELTIFSTVKSTSFGLFAKRSRRICDVRAFSAESAFLPEVPATLLAFLLVVEDLSRAVDDFVTGLFRRWVVLDGAPGSARISRVRAADALMRFLAVLAHHRRSAHHVKGEEKEESVNKTKIVYKNCCLLTRDQEFIGYAKTKGLC